MICWHWRGIMMERMSRHWGKYIHHIHILQKQTAHHTAKKIHGHMQPDGIFQIPRSDIEKSKEAAAFMTAYGLMIAGNIIGLVLTTAIGFIRGEQVNNALLTVISEGNIWISAIYPISVCYFILHTIIYLFLLISKHKREAASFRFRQKKKNPLQPMTEIVDSSQLASQSVIFGNKPEWAGNMNIVLAVTMIPLYVIGYPLAFWIMKKNDAKKSHRSTCGKESPQISAQAIPYRSRRSRYYLPR